jgi:hypothetical protein
VIKDGGYAHRVIGVYNDYVVTKGDNNLYSDDRLYYRDIKAVVCGVLRT